MSNQHYHYPQQLPGKQEALCVQGNHPQSAWLHPKGTAIIT